MAQLSFFLSDCNVTTQDYVRTAASHAVRYTGARWLVHTDNWATYDPYSPLYVKVRKSQFSTCKKLSCGVGQGSPSTGLWTTTRLGTLDRAAVGHTEEKKKRILRHHISFGQVTGFSIADS